MGMLPCACYLCNSNRIRMANLSGWANKGEIAHAKNSALCD